MDSAIEWPSLGTMCEWVDVHTIQLANGHEISRPQELQPYNSLQHPGEFYVSEGELQLGVVMHHYPYMTVMGHYFASGTYVYYLPDDNEFYLWGDDWMSHLDGMVGPFLGNPTLLIPEAVEPYGGPHPGSIKTGSNECEG